MESEYLQQVRLVAWFRKAYPNELIFHIPNGGGRTKAEGAKLKNMGVVRGVPDLFIPYRRTFIEMKTEEGGSVSKEQKAVMAMLELDGYRCFVCHGFEAAKSILTT